VQPFLLESGNMGQTGEEEQVEVLRLPRTGNDATRKNVANFVAFIRREIQDGPYIDPAVGFFIAKELCAIDRKHQDSVVVPNRLVFYRVDIVGSAQDIIPDEVGTLIIISQNIFCLVLSVVHLLSLSRTLPLRLKLWTDGKHRE
jgi:hypothetical protein